MTEEGSEGFDLSYVLYLIALAGVLALISWKLGFIEGYGEVLGSILGLVIGWIVLTILIQYKITEEPSSMSSYLSWSNLSWWRKLGARIVTIGSIFLGLGAVYGWGKVLAEVGPVPWPIKLVTGLPIFFGVMFAFIFILFRTVIFPKREE